MVNGLPVESFVAYEKFEGEEILWFAFSCVVSKENAPQFLRSPREAELAAYILVGHQRSRSGFNRIFPK